MRALPLFVCCLALFVAAGCGKRKETAAPAPAPAESTAAAAGIDACALLKSEDLQAVIGEPIKETKPSFQSPGGLAVSQCYFTLPTAVKSVTLAVVQKGKATNGRDVKEFWREQFGKPGDAEKSGGADEEGHRKAQKIDGIGDEAWWTATAVGGALYVLKGESYVRISVGGGEPQESKIQKSRALAEIVLRRL